MKKTGKNALSFFALVLIAAMLTLSLAGCGKNISKTDALTTEHFTVTDAMVSYSLYDTYYYYLNTYGKDAMAYYFGIDTSVSLKDQYYEDGLTWFDVFLKDSVNSYTTALVLCEEAYARGMTLSDIDKKFIDSEIKEIEDAAAKEGLKADKYISKLYGKGVTIEDVRDSIELYRLANKCYYAQYYSFDITDDELEEYVNENLTDFITRDIKSVKLKRSSDETAEAHILAFAESIKAAGSESEFTERAEAYFGSEYCIDEGGEIKSETKKYADTSDLEKWLFSEETKTGSTYMITTDTAFTVYIAVSDMKCDTTPTRSMYHILISSDIYDSDENSKLFAEKLHSDWLAAGASLEEFKALAEEYTTDYASASTCGYYTNIAEGELTENIDKWIFSDERKISDSAVIKSDYGYHVVYYAGESGPYWKGIASEAVRTDKLTDKYNEYADKYKVTVLEENFKYINGI